MTILGIIPSRYNSTRFPGKPFAIINGKTMIQRVYEQASKSNALKKVVVATDDDRIFKHVKEFGGEVVMTSAEHSNGTERCAETLLLMNGDFDAVINIQGDEPFIQPEQIDLVADCLKEGAQIATLVKRITITEDLMNSSVVKAIVDMNSEAVNFNRGMKFPEQLLNNKNFLDTTPCYKHIGIYGYKAAVLQAIVKLPLNPIEKSQSLEQLRWLQHGYKIKVKETTLETQAVDTPEDLERMKQPQP